MKAILDTLAAFQVRAAVRQVEQGPRVTRYTLSIEPGIRVGKVHRLEPDISVAVGRPVRVCVGSTVTVEVPNKHSRMVTLQDVPVAGEPLLLPLGVALSGEPVTVDLARLPHLLVCGTTGSGKSVFLNSCIVSLVRRNGPDVLRLALIDPKRVEMAAFAQLPHTIGCATTVPAAVDLLAMLAAEMERRYSLIQAEGVRNVEELSTVARATLPYMVVVIDELADLMLSERETVEPLICKLATLARACGIHLLCATQRPDAKIITGLIKANMPSRVSFAVPSKTDSRVILDENGAELLLGNGDMLYRAAGKPLARLQGCFVSRDEIEALAAEQGTEPLPFDDPRPKPEPVRRGSSYVPPYASEKPRIELPEPKPAPAYYWDTPNGARTICAVILWAAALTVIALIVSPFVTVR